MFRLLALVPAAFVLLWSTGFIGARYAMPHAEPFTFLAIRFALAFAILAPIALARPGRWPSPRAMGDAAIAGGLIHGLYLGGTFYAIRHGLPAGIAALVAGLQPLLTALLAGCLLGERVEPRQWFGLALGLLGAVLVILPKLGDASSFDPLILAPAFLGVAAITVGTIWQKRFGGGVDLVAGTTVQYLGALVPVTLGAFLLETRAVEWTGAFVWALAWLTLALSIGAVFILLFMIREGAVSKVSSLMYLVPGTTAVMAFFLFGETLLPVQLFGLVLAGIGVAAATRRRKDGPMPAGRDS